MSKFSHPAIERYMQTVCYTSANVHDALKRVFAITWRPGDQTSNFIGKALRPIGNAVMVVLQYETVPGAGQRAPQRRMPLHGFRAQQDQNGLVTYSDLFAYDARRKPDIGAKGRVLDPVRNPTMVETAMLMHRACTKRAGDTQQLPPLPRLPRLMLAYPAKQLPHFQESPLLRQIVADRLNIRVGKLGTREPVMLNKLMLNIWEEQILLPGVGINDTEFALIDAELVKDPKGSVRTYEDFTPLLGVQTWNPAREVLSLKRKNPAGDILRMHRIDPTNQVAINSISMQQADQMVMEMRRHLGGGNELFDESELGDALYMPMLPVVSVLKNTNEALEKIGEKVVVQAMRDLLTPILSEGATDEDLLRAARDVGNPLCCSGACQVQVLMRQKTTVEDSFDFTPEMLGRKVHANLYRPWDRPRAKPVVMEQHVPRQRPVVEPVAPAVPNAPYQPLAGMHVAVAPVATAEFEQEQPVSAPVPPTPEPVHSL